MSTKTGDLGFAESDGGEGGGGGGGDATAQAKMQEQINQMEKSVNQILAKMSSSRS